jgi:long-chain acyl-CoA synthetase
LLSKTAVVHPGRLAVAKGAREQTYRETDRRVNALASSLESLGIGTGERVGVLQANGVEYLESFFACFKSGLCVVPVNHRLHREEWSWIFDDADASAVIFTPEFLGDVLAVREKLPGVRHWICAGAGSAPGVLAYEDLIAAGSSTYAEAEVDPASVAWLFYSSGTTGKPKGCMFTHRMLLRLTMNLLADVMPLRPDDAILHAAPMSHGSGTCMLPNVAKGAANVILDAPSFEPGAVFRTIEERRITNFFAAPTMVKVLLDSPLSMEYGHSSLRYVVYGGAPMYVEDLKAAIAKFGPVFVQIYGQAESPMTITALARDEHIVDGDPAKLKRLGSAGVARTDVEVKIFDDLDRELPPGSMGEIVTRSELVMPGYWKNPAATAAALRGGWLHTGDMGMMDAQGYVYILDRSRDMIISGGSNVYPREVEEVLLTHPAVSEVCVIGVPDEKWGESVKALVVARAGATEHDLIEHCRAHLAAFKKPKSVEFRSALPKNSYGKVLKRELRAPYWEGRARKV